MLYLARLAWDALLVSSTALPLQRNSTLGMSMLRSLPAHVSAQQAQHSTALESTTSFWFRKITRCYKADFLLSVAAADRSNQLQHGANTPHAIAAAR
jgi:hypothetical protein